MSLFEKFQQGLSYADFIKKYANDVQKQRWQQTMEQNLRKSISTDFENKVKMLEDVNKDNEEKLRASRQKELEFLKKEQELKNRESEMELSYSSLSQLDSVGRHQRSANVRTCNGRRAD